MARELKNDVPRARLGLARLTSVNKRRLAVHAAGINLLTIRRRLSYKSICSAMEEHDADVEDPDH